MTSLEITKKAVAILDSKKAVDIKAIRVRNLTIIADYFVVATGTSSTQVKSLADELEFQLKEQGVMPTAVEGYNAAQWIALDYENVLVHIFYPESRKFYDLERLWADGERLDLSDILKED